MHDLKNINYMEEQLLRSVQEEEISCPCSAPRGDIIIKNFRDGFLPYIRYEVKDFFEEIKKDFSPDIIFTHYREDLHQDHRLICELTWNTFRDHLILEYEMPKFDGDMGTPNLFVYQDVDIAYRKINTILNSYITQSGKHWFERKISYQ